VRINLIKRKHYSNRPRSNHSRLMTNFMKDGFMFKQVKKLSLTLVFASAVMSTQSVGKSALAQDSQQVVAVMNGQVHTVTGAIIEEGDVIIRNGEIIDVGANLAPPQGARVIDARGQIVTPGFIAPFSQIGLVEVGAVADSNDSRPNQNFPLGASLNAADAFNPASSLIAINRAGGITRAVTLPGNGGSIFGGRGIMVDLSGNNRSITRKDIAQSVLLGNGGAGRTGNTRLGVWAIVREAFDEAQLYSNNPAGYRASGNDRYTVTDLKALLPVLEGRQPLLVSVNRASDIRNVIKLKNDYRLKIIILGGNEAWREARALAAADIPLIINPLSNLPSQFENISATLKNAGLLYQAGVKVSFYGTASGSHNLRLLPQSAGNAVANGLPYDAALAALTINPAKMFGVDDMLGTIEVGKRGDIVVWDGDPFELATRPSTVLINGEVQDLENRQTRLSDRYRVLERGDLPHAYRGDN